MTQCTRCASTALMAANAYNLKTNHTKLLHAVQNISCRTFHKLCANPSDRETEHKVTTCMPYKNTCPHATVTIVFGHKRILKHAHAQLDVSCANSVGCHRNKLVKSIILVMLKTSLPHQSTSYSSSQKLGMFRVTQSSADQSEICKTRRHKLEQTVNKQENKKPTNNFTSSSLTWKMPVQDR